MHKSYTNISSCHKVGLLYSLKQHNGEIKGGAKATQAGRPWICACTIHGFKDQSQGIQLNYILLESCCNLGSNFKCIAWFFVIVVILDIMLPWAFANLSCLLVSRLWQ